MSEGWVKPSGFMGFLTSLLMLLQVCTSMGPSAARSATVLSLGSTQYWWIWGVPFDSVRLMWGRAGSSRLTSEGGLEWQKTLQYFSNCISLLQGGPAGSPVGGSAVSSPWPTPASSQLKRRKRTSARQVSLTPIPCSLGGLVIRSQHLSSWERFRRVITHALLLWVEKWLDNFWNFWCPKV